jgi:Skp family chaperone for outer membrane proteins
MSWMAILAALGTAAYLGSTLGAKPAPAGGPLPTRVAMLNLRLVIKKYKRYQDFIDEFKKTEKSYVDQLEARQKELEEASKQGDAPEEMRLQKEIEDLRVKARKDASERSNKAMLRVYKEVREASARYAQVHGIDLVLHYEGAAEKEEVDSTVLINRNLTAGGCVPLYWNDALDISAAIEDALNKSYKRGAK